MPPTDKTEYRPVTEVPRRLNVLINSLRLEAPIAHLPEQMRHWVARRRYGWIDSLKALRMAANGPYGLAPMEEQNALFIHVPKAAGVSVSKALFGNYGGSHTPLYMYLALYGARRFDRMFKFSFVRHPCTRTVSAFYFLKGGGMTEADRTWAESALSRFDTIDDFVRNGLPDPKIRKWVHFRDQTYFLIDPRSQKLGVDFLGKFEQIDRDFQEICRRLGRDQEISHLNKKKVAAPADISAGTLDLIKKAYERDMVELGYD